MTIDCPTGLLVRFWGLFGWTLYKITPEDWIDDGTQRLMWLRGVGLQDEGILSLAHDMVECDSNITLVMDIKLKVGGEVVDGY